MAIPGYPTIHGDGQLFTTAAGVLTIITAGNGSPDTNGDRHGLTGATAVVTMRGHHLAPALALVSHSAAVTECLMTTGSALRKHISAALI